MVFPGFRLCRQSSSDLSDFGASVSAAQIPVPVRSVGSPLILFQIMEEAENAGQLAQGLSPLIADLGRAETRFPVGDTGYRRVRVRNAHC